MLGAETVHLEVALQGLLALRSNPNFYANLKRTHSPTQSFNETNEKQEVWQYLSFPTYVS